MSAKEVYKTILDYLTQDKQALEEAIEELDSYNGYLNDDRYYDMELLNEFYHDTEPLEFAARMFYGYDKNNYITDEYGRKEYSAFNPNRNYFSYNGYGNLISSDYKDYSVYLDNYLVEALIDNYSSLYLDEHLSELIELYIELAEGQDNESN